MFKLHIGGSLVAVLFAHVDDLLVAIDSRCKPAADIIEKLKKQLHLGTRHAESWEYCGKTIHVTKQITR